MMDVLEQATQALKDAARAIESLQDMADAGTEYEPHINQCHLAIDALESYSQPIPDDVRIAVEVAIELLSTKGDAFVDLGAMTVLQDWLAARKLISPASSPPPA